MADGCSSSGRAVWWAQAMRGDTLDVPYRFDRFQRQLLYHDLRFEGGPGPGERFPEFGLPTTDGRRIDLAAATSQRPMLMIFASFT